jgi:hypothetical protein
MGKFDGIGKQVVYDPGQLLWVDWGKDGLYRKLHLDGYAFLLRRNPEESYLGLEKGVQVGILFRQGVTRRFQIPTSSKSSMIW